MKRLGQILPLEYGKALPARDRSNGGGTTVFGSSGPVGEHSEALLKGPSVIVGRKGSAGAVHYCNGPCWPIDTAYYIRLTDGTDPRYAYHLLTSLRLDKLDQSTAIPSLGRDTYGAIIAPFPDLETQRLVADRIDQLFAELDDGEEELRRARVDLETYRKSLLKAAVTGELTANWRAANPPKESGADLLARILADRRARWQSDPKNRGKRYTELQPVTADALQVLPDGWVWTTVRQLNEFLTSGSRGWSNFYAPSGAIFIRAQNINRDQLDLSDVAFVQLKSQREGTRSRVRRGDLLVTITGANVTKTALIDQEIDEAYVSQHVALLRLSKLVSSLFVWLWLITPAGGRRQLEAAAYGAGKPGLNLPNILDVSIPLPPRAEQDEIYRLVQAEQAKLRNLTDGIPASDEMAHLRQSILAAAFRGALVQ